MEITILTPEMSGKEISCIIGGQNIPSAKIYYERGEYFIIQDYKCGGWDSIVKRSGFKYKHGWKVQKADNPGHNSVSNIYLKDNILSNYEIY